MADEEVVIANCI